MERRIKVNLNITPLIDVVFLLLIFFMLSYHFVDSSGIKLTLPKATTSQSRQEGVIISIRHDNEVYLNDENMTLDDLPGRLASAIKNASQKTVIIKADEKINLKLAVQVMDIAKQAQAQGLVISTRTEHE